MTSVDGFDISARSWWVTDDYMLWNGEWYRFNQRGDDLWVYSSNLLPLPEGFAEMTTRPLQTNGFVKTSAAQVGPVVRVQTLVLWKNVLWDVLGVRGDGEAVLLSRLTGLPDDYVDGRPYPPELLFRGWPGVVFEDRDLISVWVRPAELAGVRVDVTPVELPRVLRDERLSWWRESLVRSPFVSGEDAVVLVREFVARTEIVVGEYPMEDLVASRLRDGWRVWAQPPQVRDVADLRLGWAVFYVADDGVVVRSSTSVSFEESERGLSNELLARSMAAPRIASSGPVSVGVGPELMG